MNRGEVVGALNLSSSSLMEPYVKLEKAVILGWALNWTGLKLCSVKSGWNTWSKAKCLTIISIQKIKLRQRVSTSMLSKKSLSSQCHPNSTTSAHPLTQLPLRASFYPAEGHASSANLETLKFYFFSSLTFPAKRKFLSSKWNWLSIRISWANGRHYSLSRTHRLNRRL